jgi:hypothetical protein
MIAHYAHYFEVGKYHYIGGPMRESTYHPVERWATREKAQAHCEALRAAGEGYYEVFERTLEVRNDDPPKALPTYKASVPVDGRAYICRRGEPMMMLWPREQIEKFGGVFECYSLVSGEDALALGVQARHEWLTKELVS